MKHPLLAKRETLKREALRQAIVKVLLERYYAVDREETLDYHHETADRIMRLLSEWTPS